MTEQELQAIEERWAKAYDGDDRQAVRKAMKDVSALLAEVRRLNNELKEANATIDTHNEMIERQHSEIGRLNELFEMRCANCHLRKESEVADK